MIQLSPGEVEALAVKWLDGTLTPAEEALFNQWYEQQPRPVIDIPSGDETAEDFRDRVLAGIRASLRKGRPAARIRRHRRLVWAAAAILLLAAGLGIYTWMQHGHTPVVKLAAIDVAPGGSRAMLTLASGQTIYLDDAHNGQLASQGDMQVVKLDSGLLAYQAGKAPAGSNGSVVWNTLSTPVGGDYRLVLADGSRVWLNAASSIRYPAAFTGGSRTVEITGEVYFEVVHNAKMPFRVVAGGTVVNDLGTHFNINAYKDEPSVKVTLLEGAVQVEQPATHAAQLMKPGQQVSVDKSGAMHLDAHADVDGAVAWKDGLFNFNGQDLQAVMRQLERWYNVSVSYPDKVPAFRFGGDTYRNTSLAEVLRVLELNGVHCKLREGSAGKAARIIIGP